MASQKCMSSTSSPVVTQVVKNDVLRQSCFEISCQTRRRAFLSPSIKTVSLERLSCKKQEHVSSLSSKNLRKYWGRLPLRKFYRVELQASMPNLNEAESDDYQLEGCSPAALFLHSANTQMTFLLLSPALQVGTYNHDQHIDTI